MHGRSDARGVRGLLERGMREPEFARRYDVTRFQVLGEGGFACVARVFDRDLGSDVAVKLFWRTTEEMRARIRAEVANAQRIRSELAVQIHSVSFGEECAWLQMELVDGPSLEHELERRLTDGAPFTLTEALRFARDAADALAQAHAVGIAHRDVKPSNYLLPPDRKPYLKLGDFGISKHRDADNLTATGEFPGTPAYAAIEVFDGRSAGTRSDAYSLGLVLFRILSGGQYAYDLGGRPTPLEYLSAHRRGRPRRLRDLVPDVPRSVDQAVAAALDKNPDDRPDAAALRDVLDRAYRGEAAPHAHGFLRPTRVRRLVSLGGLAAALLLGVVLAGARWDSRPASGPVANGGPVQVAAAAPDTNRPLPGAVPVSNRAETIDARHAAPAVTDKPAPPPVKAAVLLPSAPATQRASPASSEPAPPPVEPNVPAPVETMAPAPAQPSDAPPTLAPVVVSAETKTVPDPGPAPAPKSLRVLPPVVMRGSSAQPGERWARLDLDVIPNHVMPGEPYVVEVRLVNEGARPVRIASLSVVDTQNGRRQGGRKPPLAREIKAGQQALVNRVQGRWPADLSIWSLEVFLTADEGDTVKGMVTWR